MGRRRRKKKNTQSSLDTELIRSIKTVAETDEGKVLIYYIVSDLCGFFRSGGSLDPQALAYEEGKREVGAEIMSMVSVVDPQNTLGILGLMLKQEKEVETDEESNEFTD